MNFAQYGLKYTNISKEIQYGNFFLMKIGAQK